jgi:hypothetical protein
VTVVGVGVTRAVGVTVGVLVGGVMVPVGVSVKVGVTVGVLVGVPVLVEVGVTVGVNVSVMVPVDVGVGVGVTVGVRVKVNVFVGVKVGVLVGVFEGVGPAPTMKHWENSEVLLLGSVAVAVMASPMETVTESVASNEPEQLASVETVVGPRNNFPSPNPEGSQDGLAKSSIRNGPVLAVLSNVPWMLVVPTPAVTEVMTGKFCFRLEPESPSQ